MSAAEKTVDWPNYCAELGWRILPVWGIVDKACGCPDGKACARGHGKHPRTANGFKGATSDLKVVSKWSRVQNFGVRTGQGIFVLDVDVRPNRPGDESLGAMIAKYGPLPETVTALTGGGGQHYYFRGDLPSGGHPDYPGIDFKGDGGYVIMPPSNHISGAAYRWEIDPSEMALAPVPEWLAELVGKRASKSRMYVASGFTASDSFMGEVFRQAHLDTQPGHDGKLFVRCPWDEQHTSPPPGQPLSSTTIVMAPHVERGMGWFKCSHGGCTEKKNRDVLAFVGPDVVARATRLYPQRPRAVDDDTPPPESAPKDWRARLKMNPKRSVELEKSLLNVLVVLTESPEWAGQIRRNDFTGQITSQWRPWDSRGEAPWTDVDDIQLVCWLRERHHTEFAKSMVVDAVIGAAGVNSYHPVRDYLSGTHWDGRVRHLFHDYFGADLTPYTEAIGRKWLISAVARVMRPGCKVDTVPILEGPQGVGKSRGLQALASKAWFGDSFLDPRSKDAHTAMSGKWIWELGELTSLRTGDVNAVKAFISQETWRGRKAYARHDIDLDRQTVFAGTTNDDEYLVDSTGNRRFWPVACGRINVDAIYRDRDQIWAEAFARYQSGEPWFVDTPYLREACEAEAAKRMVTDPWQVMVSGWLGTVDLTRGVRIEAVMRTCLGLDTHRLDQATMKRVASVLRALGLERRKVRVVEGPEWRYVPSAKGEHSANGVRI